MWNKVQKNYDLWSIVCRVRQTYRTTRLHCTATIPWTLFPSMIARWHNHFRIYLSRSACSWTWHTFRQGSTTSNNKRLQETKVIFSVGVPTKCVTDLDQQWDLIIFESLSKQKSLIEEVVKIYFKSLTMLKLSKSVIRRCWTPWHSILP